MAPAWAWAISAWPPVPASSRKIQMDPAPKTPRQAYPPFSSSAAPCARPAATRGVGLVKGAASGPRGLGRAACGRVEHLPRGLSVERGEIRDGEQLDREVGGERERGLRGASWPAFSFRPARCVNGWNGSGHTPGARGNQPHDQPPLLAATRHHLQEVQMQVNRVQPILSLAGCLLRGAAPSAPAMGITDGFHRFRGRDGARPSNPVSAGNRDEKR